MKATRLKICLFIWSLVSAIAVLYSFSYQYKTGIIEKVWSQNNFLSITKEWDIQVKSENNIYNVNIKRAPVFFNADIGDNLKYGIKFFDNRSYITILDRRLLYIISFVIPTTSLLGMYFLKK